MDSQPHAYTYITTATSTQVVTGACTLLAIVLNATQTGSIKVIDGITGSTPNIASIPAGTTAMTFRYGKNGITLGNGLRIVTSSSADITVVWTRV